MKHLLTSIIAIGIVNTANAQIARTNIVEHFTNSNCGVCAGTNPTIYSALNANPNVLHITFHPSSPYASCVFSQANKTENDARTTFYNIYGSTPRVITNGVLGSASALSSNLTSIASGTTNFSLKATQQFITADSVLVEVIVKKIASDTTTTANIFVGAKQDTVNQTTGNGESIHQDVFRKALTNVTGNAINLPTAVNDSVVLKYYYRVASNWIASRMQTIAILQAPNKAVINAAESSNITVVQVPTGVNDIIVTKSVIYPNPTNGNITIQDWKQYNKISLYNNVGALLMHNTLTSAQVNLSNLAQGVYYIKLIGEKHITTAAVQLTK